LNRTQVSQMEDLGLGRKDFERRFPNRIMNSSRAKAAVMSGIVAGLICLSGAAIWGQTQDPFKGHEPTTVTVYVKEADTGEPISQGAVTLKFTEPVTFGPGNKLNYTSKTDAQGRCKLYQINKGTIILMVTAPHHQSYGKQLELDHDNQVFEVRLKRPQPLL
jgi:hypothetical protein